MKHIVFATIVLSVFFSGDNYAVNGAKLIMVEDDRLSVNVEGMALGELLIAVEDLTGVQFKFDELVATKEIFLDFRGLPLSEGIRKIIYHLNSAKIYDDRGKLYKVIILRPWKGSGLGISITREGRNDFPEAPIHGPSNAILYTSKKEPDSPQIYSKAPIEEGSAYFDGPPVDKAYSGSKPPNAQGEIPEDLPFPIVTGSVYLPIPDSKGAPVEVPRVDKTHAESTPPDSQGEILENLPIPGVASSKHLPIPGS